MIALQAVVSLVLGQIQAGWEIWSNVIAGIVQVAWDLNSNIFSGSLNNILAVVTFVIKQVQLVIDTVMNVIKALGCGIDLGKKQKDLPKFDINKLRYGKIICASDEDPDGAQIQCLIITLFYKLMPEIIRKGKLYIAQTPLFEIKLKDDKILYAYTDEGKEKIIDEQGNKIVQISRSKG